MFTVASVIPSERKNVHRGRGGHIGDVPEIEELHPDMIGHWACLLKY